MAFRLVQVVIESHGLEGVPTERGAGALTLRADQVLLEGAEAPLVVAALERAGVESVRVHPALAGPGRAPGGGEAEPESHWQRAALRLGMLVPRPGQGDTEIVHRERLAAPGRLMVCAGRLAACGAFGMLAFEADALVAAAVLAGGPFTRPLPRVLGVYLTGSLPAGTCGVDLALALLSRLRESGEAADVIEFGGPGVDALPMADRVGTAWVLAEMGLPALFPSDEITRAELSGLGREQDWRRLEASEDGAAPVWRLDLGALESLMAPAEDPADSRPVRALAGTGVERVLAGPGATLADFASIAHQLGGRRVHELVDCALVAGSRSLLDRAVAAGIVERLASAGVSVGEGQVSARAVGSGTGLCVGVPLAVVTSGRARWWLAGAASCGAGARAGCVARPSPEKEEARQVLDAGSGLAGDPWLPTDVAAEPATDLAGPESAEGCFTPWRGPFRAEVLAVLGDSVESARLIPLGARLESLRGRLSSLASQVLSGTLPGFAERARARGGGLLVAGHHFGVGEPRAAAALCLGELAVRAVLAHSYAPGVVATLVHAGVMPLVWEEEPGRATLECGDELELPGLPDGLMSGRALTARNLTRGTQLTLQHELLPDEIEVLRVGGLLPFVLGGPRLRESR